MLFMLIRSFHSSSKLMQHTARSTTAVPGLAGCSCVLMMMTEWMACAILADGSCPAPHPHSTRSLMKRAWQHIGG